MIITGTKTDHIRSYYSPRRHGANTSEILGWENREAHFARFEILKHVLNDRNRTKPVFTLLDIGSGLGDLYSFLSGDFQQMQYTGVDILPEMTSSAKKRFPNVDFLTADIFSEAVFSSKSFDFLFSSGIFNINLGNNYEFMTNAVNLMISLACESVVFNCLSDESRDKEDGYFYYSAQRVAQIIEESQNFVDFKIIDGYLHNDFSVVIRIKK